MIEPLLKAGLDAAPRPGAALLPPDALLAATALTAASGCGTVAGGCADQDVGLDQRDDFVRGFGQFFACLVFFQFALGGFFSVLSAVAAAWYPARKAAQVRPVDIIRGAA